MRVLALVFSFMAIFFSSHRAAALEVGGHYEQRWVDVLVEPGHWESIYVPPRYETRIDENGKQVEVLVADGRWERRWIPPRYERRLVLVWVQGIIIPHRRHHHHHWHGWHGHRGHGCDDGQHGHRRHHHHRHHRR
jgi:hypothetical protein